MYKIIMDAFKIALLLNIYIKWEYISASKCRRIIIHALNYPRLNVKNSFRKTDKEAIHSTSTKYL